MQKMVKLKINFNNYREKKDGADIYIYIQNY